MLRTFSTASALIALAVLLSPAAFAQQAKAPAHSHAHSDMSLPTQGVAVVMPTQGNKVRGTIRLVEKDGQLHMTGKIRNLTPGDHGFHIHEFGDLRNMADGTSTGGHFNPSGVPHGALGHGHVGDLGNITADAEGVATVDVTVEKTQLHFVLGRAFVVHGGKDDLKSQPSGDAGPRVGVGVIGVGNPEFKYAPKAN